MQSFLSKFTGAVRGVLSGLDRIFFRQGTLCTNIAYVKGLRATSGPTASCYKDFAQLPRKVTAAFKMPPWATPRNSAAKSATSDSPEAQRRVWPGGMSRTTTSKVASSACWQYSDPCLSVQVHKNYPDQN